jgi:hypothetical protein
MNRLIKAPLLSDNFRFRNDDFHIFLVVNEIPVKVIGKKTTTEFRKEIHITEHHHLSLNHIMNIHNMHS